MSDQFLGLTMLVTLNSPPGAQLRGIVDSVEPGKSLTLRHVTCPSNGKYVREITIDALEIEELVEAPNESESRPPNLSAPLPTIAVPATKLEDPAILSMGRKPSSTLSSTPALPQWNPTATDYLDATMRKTSSRNSRGVEEAGASTLVEPIQQLYISEVEANDIGGGLILDEKEEDASAAPQVVKQKRFRKRKQRKGANSNDLPEPDVTPAKETTKSKGWRQTPLLEPNPSFQPFATLKRQRAHAHKHLDENGWATEDATDVQDLGDFNFAESLAKFDKQTVFTQIQANDVVADEDRLVAHNRIPRPKPGTAGGKNLHYTENVLDVPNGNARGRNSNWESELGGSDREDRASQNDTGRGRASRRTESILTTNRRPISRVAGSIGPGQSARALSFHSTTSHKPTLYLVPSDRRCEPVSALQMLNLENIADNELGLSEDMMTENAGRGIAEVALSALNTSERGLVQGTNRTNPTIIVLAGNNKNGLRGVAAGRHLRNHGANVVVCVLGLDRETELLVGLRRQLKVFRSFGGKIVTKTELFEYAVALTSPIELFIDGLLGLTISFEELRTGDQAAAYELIEFANRSKAPALAIDVPTGIDPTSGKVSIIDGRQLYIHARYVVAMGAPKKGLVETMALGEGTAEDDGLGESREWQLFVADIGLGAAAWKRAGTRVRRGVDFEGSWVLGMRFQGSGE